MTGAGGDGGPRGIFLFVLNLGGSMGSFCVSTMRITRCLAPELKANPCCEGVYLKQYNTYSLGEMGFLTSVVNFQH